MITIQNADSALKDYYLDAVTAQLNDNVSPFFSAIEKNSDYVLGKDVKLAVIRGYSGNVVAGAITADILNLKGLQLPATGGIGTTIFYVVGGLLAAGAGVLLITKKRMRKEQ